MEAGRLVGEGGMREEVERESEGVEGEGGGGGS